MFPKIRGSIGKPRIREAILLSFSVKYEEVISGLEIPLPFAGINI